MLAIFTVLFLITVYVPIVSIASALFLLLPFLLYSSKYPIGQSAALLAGAGAVSFIAGGLFSVPVAVMYGTTGMALGILIQRKAEGWILFMAGTIVFLVNVVVQYAAASFLFDLSFFDEVSRTVKASIEQSQEIIGGEAPYSAADIDSVIAYIGTLLPAMFVITSFIAMLIMMAVNIPIARRLGVDVKPLPRVRDIRLPKAILWYYLLFMVGALIVQPEAGTAWYDIYVNIMFILQGCLFVQGVALLFFYAHFKKWPGFLPVFITIFALLFVPLLYLIRLLGIIDLGFDLRQRIQKKP